MTVRNLRTGQTGHTAALGSGIRKGALAQPSQRRRRRQLRNHPHRHRLQGRSRRLHRLHLRRRQRRLALHHRRPRRRPRRTLRLPHPWIQPSPSRKGFIPGRARKTPKELGGIRVRAAFVVQRVRGSRAHPPRRRIVGRLRVHGRVGGAKARRGQNRRLAIQIGRKGHWRTVGRARLRPRGRFSLQVRLVVHGRVRGLMLRAAIPHGRSKEVRVRARRRGSHLGSRHHLRNAMLPRPR